MVLKSAVLGIIAGFDRNARQRIVESVIAGVSVDFIRKPGHPSDGTAAFKAVKDSF